MSQATGTLSEGVLLTKYSRTNAPSSRLVKVVKKTLTWTDEAGDSKWYKKTIRYEITAIHPFLPGSLSSHWFDSNTPPPPLSFAIVTKSRILRFTAPSLEVFVLCVNEVEEALGDRTGNIIHSGVRDGADARKSRREGRDDASGGGSSSQMSIDLCNIIRDGTETETFCYSIPGIQPCDFMCLYDKALNEIGSQVINNPWNGSIKSVFRTGVSKHKTSSRFFTTKVTVNKAIIGFFEKNIVKDISKPTSTSTTTSSANDVSRLVLFEMNQFSGATYIDLFIIFVKWNVYKNQHGDGVIVEVNNMICFVKDTILRYPVTSEFKKYAQFTCDTWIKFMTQHIGDIADGNGTDGLYKIMAKGKPVEDEEVSNCAKESVLSSLLSTSNIGNASRAFFTNPSEPISDHPSSGEVSEGNRIEGFICPECGVIASSQGELMAHFTVFHTDTTLLNEKNTLTSFMAGEDAASGFVCPECMSKFRSGELLTKHFDEDHGGSKQERRSIEKVAQSSASAITADTTQKEASMLDMFDFSSEISFFSSHVCASDE